jgi:hypothetical protein
VATKTIGDGFGSLLFQYRLRGASEWTTHTINTADPRSGGVEAWRRQTVPVLRRRYPGGIETRVICAEAE